MGNSENLPEPVHFCSRISMAELTPPTLTKMRFTILKTLKMTDFQHLPPLTHALV